MYIHFIKDDKMYMNIFPVFPVLDGIPKIKNIYSEHTEHWGIPVYRY